MYTEIGEVSEATIAALMAITAQVTWQLCEREDTEVHQMAGCMGWAKAISELTDRWPLKTWQQTIFLRLRPGDHLFNHVDSGLGVTIPLETNDVAVSYSSREEHSIRTRHRLDVGKAYLTDRSMWHEAFNDGATNRTNFVLILKEQQP